MPMGEKATTTQNNTRYQTLSPSPHLQNIKLANAVPHIRFATLAMSIAHALSDPCACKIMITKEEKSKSTVIRTAKPPLWASSPPRRRRVGHCPRPNHLRGGLDPCRVKKVRYEDLFPNNITVKQDVMPDKKVLN